MHRIIHSLAAFAFALLGAGTANAQTTYFPNDATINYAVTADATVGYGNLRDHDSNTNGSSPTVSLVPGGSISGFVTASNHSTVNISGGSIFGGLNALSSSAINLFGNNLTDTLVNPNLGGYSLYEVDGTLADGTALNGKSLYVQIGTGAKFTLNPVSVPEPGSVALFGGIVTVGAGILRRKRRK